MADEGEVPAEELLNLEPPKLDAKLVRELDEDQCRALIKVCKGAGELRHRRDEAIVRLMIETGVRAGEAVGTSVTDADVKVGMAVAQ